MQQNKTELTSVKQTLNLENLSLDKVKNIDLENEAVMSEESVCLFCVPLIVATIIGC